MAMKWYVVHTYSGHENKAKLSLQERVRQAGLTDEVRRHPHPDRDRRRAGQGAEAHRPRASSIPGYMFVQMDLDQETFHLVKNTPKITGFLGGTNPQPVKETEIQNINVADDRGRDPPQAAHLVRGRRDGARHRRAVRQLHRAWSSR